MAKLYFYYSAMNAGKTTTLLQSAYNYHERGMETRLFTPAIDDRYATGVIKSRIGLEHPAYAFRPDFNFFSYIQAEHAQHSTLRCICVDEAQFLTRAQVMELSDVVDELGLPVLTYGLRTDFAANLFPGSQYLLAIADELVEIKTICQCGRKAITNPRFDAEGNALLSGQQVEIGGNERYTAMCRRCFKDAHRQARLKQSGETHPA